MSEALRPSIVILDIGLPMLTGVEATSRIMQIDQGIKIIIFSMMATRQHVLALFKMGVSGFVLKEEPLAELLKAIRAVQQGATFFSKIVNETIRNHVGYRELNIGEKTFEPSDDLPLLTSREMEVFTLLANGLAIKKIAQELFISPKTVETHKYNIMEKLKVDTLAGLTKIAIRRGIIRI